MNPQYIVFDDGDGGYWTAKFAILHGGQVVYEKIEYWHTLEAAVKSLEGMDE